MQKGLKEVRRRFASSRSFPSAILQFCNPAILQQRTHRVLLGVVSAVMVPLSVGGWLSLHTVEIRAQDRKTVLDGVYNPAQASRGKSQFETHCVTCHKDDLTGDVGPALVGAAFNKKWNLQTVNQLFTEVKTRMPDNEPGSLKDETYLDIVTYILQTNKFPAGEEELAVNADVLGNILITTKGGKAAAPTEVTTGSLVQVVGCLTQGPDASWSLTNASVPVRTENPDPSTAGQLTKLDAVPLGAQNIRLLNVFTALDSHKGHKMEGKGFLVKDPSGDRITVVALEMIAPGCGQ
jgi:mono/diheme cytochrome c family protein